MFEIISCTCMRASLCSLVAAVYTSTLLLRPQVVPSTQAEQGGVQRGWQLTAVGSFPVTTTAELIEALKQYKEGLRALRAMALEGKGSTAAAEAATVSLSFVTTEAAAAAGSYDSTLAPPSPAWTSPSSPSSTPTPSSPFVTSAPPSAAPSAPPSARSQMAPELSREDAIVQGRERLTSRLATETLKEAEMEDDGNCQVVEALLE